MQNNVRGLPILYMRDPFHKSGMREEKKKHENSLALALSVKNGNPFFSPILIFISPHGNDASIDKSSSFLFCLLLSLFFFILGKNASVFRFRYFMYYGWLNDKWHLDLWSKTLFWCFCKRLIDLHDIVFIKQVTSFFWKGFRIQSQRTLSIRLTEQILN